MSAQVTPFQSREDQHARWRRRDHANIEAMQNRIIQGIVDETGIPFPPKLRAFISALQSAHGGGVVANEPFKRSHLSVAQYLQFKGSEEAREARVRRLIESLEEYQQKTGVLLFAIKRGGELRIAEDGSQQHTATEYTDLLKPIADAAMMRARASELWGKHPGIAMDAQLEWGLSELVKFDPASDAPAESGEMELSAYAETQRGRLKKSAAMVADKIQTKGGRGSSWLRALAKSLLQEAALMEGSQIDDGVTNLLPREEEEPRISEEKMSKLDAALAYAARGWRVFPCQDRGKEPRIKKWQELATTDEATIRRWWQKWPEANVAIATGAGSNLFVLDVDFEKGGDASLCSLIEAHGDLETARVQTGAGLHFYFQHPGREIRNNAGRLGEGLDGRGDGGYVIAPPSAHPNGACYEWLKVSPTAPIPERLLKRLTEEKRPTATPSTTKGHARGKSAAGIGAVIPEGERNETLFRIGCAMRGQGAEYDEIESSLLETNAARCAPPLPDDEVRKIAASAAKYPVNSKA